MTSLHRKSLLRFSNIVSVMIFSQSCYQLIPECFVLQPKIRVYTNRFLYMNYRPRNQIHRLHCIDLLLVSYWVSDYLPLSLSLLFLVTIYLFFTIRKTNENAILNLLHSWVMLDSPRLHLVLLVNFVQTKENKLVYHIHIRKFLNVEYLNICNENKIG